MISKLFKLLKPRAPDPARLGYLAVAEAARRPEIYTDLGAPDSTEGRFEVLTMHVYLVLRRLKRQGPAAEAFAQRFFDAFFENMDASLRELGVGDMSIGRKVRGLAEAFYGRVGAYERALDAGDAGALAEAVARNVHGRPDPGPGVGLATYFVVAADALEREPVERLLAGDIRFADFTGKGAGATATPQET